MKKMALFSFECLSLNIFKQVHLKTTFENNKWTEISDKALLFLQE